MSGLPRVSCALGVFLMVPFLWGCGQAAAQVDASEREMNAEQMLEPLGQTETSTVEVGKLSKPETVKKGEAVKKVSQKANAGSSEMTLVGRGGAVAVVNKNGQVEEVSQQSLLMRNRAKSLGRVTLPAASQNGEKAKEQGVAEGEGAAKGQGTGAGPNAGADTKEAKSKPEDEKAKAEAEAVKKADIEKLRSVQRMNGWFYTSDGKPISSEELNKRIEKGDVAGITFMDQFQQKSTTKSKPKEESKDRQAGQASGVTSTGTEAAGTTGSGMTTGATTTEEAPK